MKLFQSFVVVLITMLAATNFSFAQETSSQAPNDLKTTTVKVTGVTCSTDLNTITTNVKGVQGVSKCIVTKKGATTIFEVAYSTSLVTREQIVAAVENTGGCKNPNEKPYKVKQ